MIITTEHVEDGTPLLFVMLEGRRFAFRLDRVLEVLPMAEPEQVPGWPRAGLGLLNVGGEVVPLVDPRSTLRLSDQTLHHRQKIVVVMVEHARWGVLVSEVLGVQNLAVIALTKVAAQPRVTSEAVSAEFAIEPLGPVAVLHPESLIQALSLPIPAGPTA